MSDLISRQAAVDALDEIRHALWEIDIPSPTVPEYVEHHEQVQSVWKLLDKKQKELYLLPSAQPERLTDDDFETIRIHLSAHKEQLCNQLRWKEAEEYQRIIDRFMAFASAQSERKKGHWTLLEGHMIPIYKCSQCNNFSLGGNYCSNCGSYNGGDKT